MKLQVKKLTYLLFAGSIFLASCGNGDNNANGDDTTLGDKMEAAVDSVQADIAENVDADFVKDAIEMNTKELAWINAGVALATDKELRGHAKMMLADHEKAGAEAMDYAASKGIAPRDVDTTNEAKMDEKKGRDWDRKWAEKMVDEHEKAINRFERAENNVNDPALKDWVSKTLPTLRSHLTMMQQMKDKLSK